MYCIVVALLMCLLFVPLVCGKNEKLKPLPKLPVPGADVGGEGGTRRDMSPDQGIFNL